MGYYYEGSDTDHHYFSSRWKNGRDGKIKIAKRDLEVSREFDLGSSEIYLTVLSTPKSGSLFCHAGLPLYEVKSN